ncbi:hypothetical protein ACHHYP_10249 [Achlya hypogyna]|uniref:Uncharacterized protein n=1 Tax=Achlya hypogyna TaxID=1202772 RepID=A0A1V9YLW3_ACHHY|nr:hypothetical protein ACHHYP_10249 [Achlya hypogyna]
MEAVCIFDGCSDAPLPGKDKCHFHRYRTKCSVDDCFNQVYARRLCVSHGGKKLCAATDCNTPARVGDYCTKHTTKPKATCTQAGCSNPAYVQGMCTRHGGGKPCSVDDCAMPARVGSFCWNHRNRVISEASMIPAAAPDNCDALAQMVDEWVMDALISTNVADEIDLDGILDDIITDFVYNHGSSGHSFSNLIPMTTTCIFNGCTNTALAFVDKCSFHRYRTKCMVEDCFNQVYARQLCVGHGGKKVCAFAKCATTVRTGDYCAKHTKKVKPICTEVGCHHTAFINQKCTHHGGGRPCSVDECMMPARMGGFCWRHRNRIVAEPAAQFPTDDGDALILMLDEWMREEPVAALADDDIDFHGYNSILSPSPMTAICFFDGCSNAPLPGKDKCHFHRYRTKCSVDDCFNQVYARRLCVSHGGKKLCAATDCNTPARVGDYCTKHTTKPKATCTQAGCSNPAYVQGMCTRHGGGKPCSVDDCAMPARVGSFCWIHRNRVISEASMMPAAAPDNCDALAHMVDEWVVDASLLDLDLEEIDLDGILNDISSLISKLTMTTPCLFNGCAKPALPPLDKCAFHRYRSKCKVDGCFNQVYARLLCVSHGGKKTCQASGCVTPVRIGEFCSKHATRPTALCDVDGCRTMTALPTVEQQLASWTTAHDRHEWAAFAGTTVTGFFLHRRYPTNYQAKMIRRKCNMSNLCVFKGCMQAVVADAKCAFHRYRTKCIVDGCCNQVYARRLCVGHGGKDTCAVAGCHSTVRAGKLCSKHGTKEACRCSEEGCSNVARVKAKCLRHAGATLCAVADCASAARVGGVCWRHRNRVVSPPLLSSSDPIVLKVQDETNPAMDPWGAAMDTLDALVSDLDLVVSVDLPDILLDDHSWLSLSLDDHACVEGVVDFAFE